MLWDGAELGSIRGMQEWTNRNHPTESIGGDRNEKNVRVKNLSFLCRFDSHSPPPPSPLPLPLLHPPPPLTGDEDNPHQASRPGGRHGAQTLAATVADSPMSIWWSRPLDLEGFGSHGDGGAPPSFVGAWANPNKFCKQSLQYIAIRGPSEHLATTHSYTISCMNKQQKNSNETTIIPSYIVSSLKYCENIFN